MTPSVIVAPAVPSGPALTAFAVQVRRAVQSGAGAVVVDQSACRGWSPGQRMVLERLQRIADHCGCRWQVAP